MPSDAESIRQSGLDAGLDAVGVASAEPFLDAQAEIERRRDEGLHGGMAFTFRNPTRSTHPEVTMAGARSLVVGALRYDRPTPPRPDGDAESARIARYAWRDHYSTLRVALGVMAAELRAEGWRAMVLADDNALVDRAAAQRAGLGWFGKNANILLPGQGSWFVLGSVLTDAPLDPSPAPVPDGCGSCTRCIDGCPTGAIVAPGVVDARRCLAWLVQARGVFPVEHRVALGDRLYGCDDCQEVCPPNRAVARRGGADEGEGEPVVSDEELEAWVPLLGLLASTDDELLERHGRWYVPDRDPAALRRNALVVLGNVGDPDDPLVDQALEAALADDRPVVRAHAVWTARRLGRQHLLTALEAEADELVRTELDRPEVPPR
jgi:epoxyqueuosine reductase